MKSLSGYRLSQQRPEEFRMQGDVHLVKVGRVGAFYRFGREQYVSGFPLQPALLVLPLAIEARLSSSR